jgi:hypothetical protein
MNQASVALLAVVSALRQHGSFNDKSVDRAFSGMADSLELRAWDIDPSSKPKSAEVVAEVVDAKVEDKPESKPVEKAEVKSDVKNDKHPHVKHAKE